MVGSTTLGCKSSDMRILVLVELDGRLGWQWVGGVPSDPPARAGRKLRDVDTTREHDRMDEPCGPERDPDDGGHPARTAPSVPACLSAKFVEPACRAHEQPCIMQAFAL